MINFYIMIERKIAHKVLGYAKQYPVVTITGPRQSGKTTLCKSLFPNHKYITLEDIENREFATKDPHGFLKGLQNGVILDEIQRVPQLLSYIQTLSDEKNQEGFFILTGSQQFEIMNQISQTLAGRTALATLLPFSLAEIWENVKNVSKEEVLFTGFYPRIYDKQLNPSEALSFYINTYVERDVRQLLLVKDLSLFEKFLKLCAGRVGQILNMNSLGNDLGVNHQTIKNWLSVLEASYIIKLLPPYHKNFNKRIIKSPKLYFVDTGLCCNLLGLETYQHLKHHPLIGSLYENLVIMEIYKRRLNLGKSDNLYFFRDNTGNEVDLILDYGSYVNQIEIKYGQTIAEDFFKGINFFRKINSEVKDSFIIYGGDNFSTRENTHIRGWNHLFECEIE